MVMPAVSRDRYWTVEEVYNLPPDSNRYEVVHGELLVTPSPVLRHQAVLMRLQTRVAIYLGTVGLSDTALPGGDYFYQSDVYVQPDFLVVLPEEMVGDYRAIHHLRLVAEVISPSSARGDRVVKRKAFQEAGVETYWVVDHDAAVVEVWHPEDQKPEIATDEIRWRVTPDAPELRIDLDQLFAPLPGEKPAR